MRPTGGEGYGYGLESELSQAAACGSVTRPSTNGSSMRTELGTQPLKDGR